MGFFKKEKHNLIEDDITLVSEPSSTVDSGADDFDDIENETEITREEFHKMAEEVLKESIDIGDVKVVTEEDYEEDTSTSSDISTDNSDDEEISEEFEDDISAVIEEQSESESAIIIDDDDFDDFSVDLPADFETLEPVVEDQQQQTQQQTEQKPKKEKKPKMTFAEFREKYRKGIKIATIALCAFLAVCLGIYIYGCATIPEGVMGRNIYIEDVNVSGLTYEEALAKVKETSLLDDCNITVVCNKQSYTINGVDVGLTARLEDTVEKAMNYGKSGNMLKDGFHNALQVVFKHTVIPSANVDEQTLRGKLTEFGNIVHGELIQHKLELGDGKVICTPGHAGFSGNTDEAYKQVIKAIEDENFSKIKVSLNPSHPKKLSVKDVDIFTYTNPQDARYEIANNTVTVVPEVWGRYLNLEETEKYLAQLQEGGDIVNIPFYASAPTVTAEELNQKLFNATLGSFYTSYGGSTANRAANVANAASKINEKILAPGEVFSFNDTVGKRSIANGFYQAPEYADGQTVMGIGGGTCQVSSTLYNAVLYADLSVVSRLNHMFAVGYCTPGQDATVSDSGVDFKFANNTDYPIKISAVTSGGRITVSILGTQRDIPHTVKIENYSSYSGGNRSVRTYRLVYDPDGNQIRKEEMPKSYYMSH